MATNTQPGKRVTVFLPADLLIELEAIAKRRYFTKFSEAVRVLLAEAIAREKDAGQ